MKLLLRKNSALTTLGVLTAILLGVYYLIFYSESPIDGNILESALKDGGSGGEYTIELREDGFHPEKLEINKGDTVKFKTTRDKPFWPASNVHPSHGIYSKFDSKEPTNPGDTWTFRFEKSGNWEYHDHLNSAFTGSLVVIDKLEGSNSSSDCDNLDALDNSKKRKCYDKFIIDAFKRGGAPEAFKKLKILYNEEPLFIEAGCHKQTHLIGDLAYGKYLKHKDLSRLDMSEETTFCGSGYYHGFLEHYLRDNPDVELAKKLCVYLEERKPGIRGTCYHGMGHGFMPDPPDSSTWGDSQAMLASTLDKCDNISVYRYEVLECYEGAFNILLDWIDVRQYHLFQDKSDPMALCSNQSNRDREEACYYEHAMRIQGLVDGDIEKIAELFIDKIEDDHMASVSMGAAVATVIEASLTKDNYTSYRSDFTGYIMSCRNLHKRLYEACVRSVSYAVIYYGKPGEEYIGALKLCGSTELSGQEKEICYERTASYITSYWPDREEEICGAFEEKYREFCQ